MVGFLYIYIYSLVHYLNPFTLLTRDATRAESSKTWTMFQECHKTLDLNLGLVSRLGVHRQITPDDDEKPYS